MDPNSITREMSDVWMLAEEVLECGARAIDHSMRSGVSPGSSSAITDWAIDYRRQLPDNRRFVAIIEVAHKGTIPPGTVILARFLLGRFYRKLHKHGIYNQGAKILSRM